MTSSLQCPDFNLAATLASGQVFRWERSRSINPFVCEIFTGWIGPNLVQVAQNGEEIFFQGASEAKVRNFFSLDVDLSAIARQIDVDPVIHAALRAHWGLRLIRQEPWECLASFILSSFNNIPRLTGMLEQLATRFGRKSDGVRPFLPKKGLTPCGFPRPEVLARVSERTLRNLGLGFRAPYLKAAAQAVASGAVDLARWRRLDDEALRASLMTIPGVGEKVAECVMLFGYEGYSAFPVDVWIGRAMRAWYFRGGKVSPRRIREFSRRHFGPHCGWAQQYLYCEARSQGSLLRQPSHQGKAHTGSGPRWESRALRPLLSSAAPDA